MISILVYRRLTWDEVNSMIGWLSENNGSFEVIDIGLTKCYLKSEDDLIAFRLKYSV